MIPLHLIGLTVLISAGQVLAQSTRKPPESANWGTLDLYEAIIRYQIKSWQQAAHTYCIEINGADPDSTLLQRLRELHVRGRSACKMQRADRHIRIVDGKKKSSVIFNLRTTRIVSESEVDVEGGYYCGDLCMADGIYRVVREASGWHVLEFEAHLTL